ncbi:hypothetical protein N7488_012363 [Penicillium malachiteum]|nr:hypothetical protein N7488_012363 [Penicillium malachiteum]
MATSTTLQYLRLLEKWNEEKPYQIVGRRPVGQQRDNIDLESHICSVQDVKELNRKFSLDVEGFRWVRHRMNESLDSEPSVMRHVNTFCTLVKDQLGAQEVLPFDYQAG